MARLDNPGSSDRRSILALTCQGNTRRTDGVEIDDKRKEPFTGPGVLATANDDAFYAASQAL